MLSLVLLCSFLTDISFAQTQRALRWSFHNENGLDFTSGSPIAVIDSLTGERGTSGICDEDGNYVFYSNGETVWQANGTIMQGGTNLVGDRNAVQSSIITPSPNSNTRYYLFVVDERTATNPIPEVHYYDVEMLLNGGNGAVIGPTLLLDSAVEKLAATRHGNDRDYWVMAHKIDSDEFHAFLVDENGVNTSPVISAVGTGNSTILSADHEGQMKFSPDGKWIATCNFSSGNVELFRFDNETGIVSDPISLATGITTFPYGCDFSADSKKFFYSRSVSNAANPVGVHQFDLDHASIDCLLASEEVVSNDDPFKLYADMQLAPDKKIYMSYFRPNPFPADSLGVINAPEEMCPDCDYEDKGFAVNNGMSYGLSNFVSSFLSDGITYTFGTNCEDVSTIFFPEDTLDLDSVRWNFGDPASGNNESTLLQASHVFSGPDTFMVTLYAHRGNETDTFTRNVIIWDRNLELLGNDTTLCNGAPVTLNASWNNACLLWSDSTTNTTYTTVDEGWHWVEVSYQSCVWRDSVFVTLVSEPPEVDLGNDTTVCGTIDFIVDPDVPNAFYAWQDGSNDTTYNVTDTGTYWLTVSNACGSSSDTLVVGVNNDAQPTLNFPSDTTVCNTDGFAVDVTFNGAAYTWSDGSTAGIRTLDQPGTYWVIVGNSCDTVSDTFDLFIDEPLFSSLPEVAVHCGDGDTLRLIGTTDTASVLWSNGVQSGVLPVTSAGNYSFSVSNTCGTYSDTVEVLAWDTNYRLSIGSDTTLCEASFGFVIGDTALDYPWNYSWNTGSSSPVITPETGVFTLTAETRCGSVSDTVRIAIANPIMINDSLIDTILCQGEERTLALTSSNPQEVNWSTGDRTPSIVVTRAGTYSVDVVDSLGCAYSDEISFSDFCPGIINAPNVFSPNGDGLNDAYCIELINVLSYKVHIYNRWGSELYFTADQSTCWDGKISGSPAASGTYFYLVEGLDALGEGFQFRGSFTLLE